ncbi:MAG: 1,2-phenylacetyl-CoA epoxidase subunit PaaC [Candidatus Phosphoribacter sp.]
MSDNGTGGTFSAQAASASYLLGLGDDALVYAQSLGSWLTWAPALEEEMALANVALDLIGQARPLLTLVGQLDGTGRSEDDLAYQRDERDFHNVHLVEQPRGDFAREMARMLWFAAYHRELYGALRASTEPTLAAIAAKALKEVRYHFDHASQWVVRLGDGTQESHERMSAALSWAAPYVDELFEDDSNSVSAAGTGLGVLPSTLRPAAQVAVEAVVTQATLALPPPSRWRSRGGRDGVHSEPMGALIAEMQHLARAHPTATW